MVNTQKKLQVFISSTYIDLKAERQAVVESVLRSGNIPAGMELFAAGNESQLEIVKRWIDTSDVYVLLLGGRYGSLEPKSQLSYTEIEYRYALEKEKPLFAIILSDEYIDQKVKDNGKEYIERKEVNKLDLFVNLVKQKISRYVENENEIRLSVMESIIDIQSRHSPKGWVREDQIPSFDGLINQINSLQKENDILNKKLKSYGTTIQDKIGDYTFEEIKLALQKREIKISRKLTNGKEIIANAFDLILTFQREISLGVSNEMGSDDIDVFLYYHVCPQLRVFELTELTKPLKNDLPKFQTSKLGNKFISLANIKGEVSRLSTKEGGNSPSNQEESANQEENKPLKKGKE